MLLKYKITILVFLILLLIQPTLNAKANPNHYGEHLSINVFDDGSLSVELSISTSEVTFEGIDLSASGWTGCLGALFFVRRGELPPLGDMGEMLMFLPQLGFVAVYPGTISLEDAITGAKQIASQFETAFQTTLEFYQGISIPMEEGESIHVIVFTASGTFEDYAKYFTQYAPSNGFSNLFNLDRFKEATGALLLFGIGSFDDEGFSQILMAQYYQKWYFSGKGTHTISVKDVFGIKTPITTYSYSNESSVEIEVPQNATITKFYPTVNASLHDNSVDWNFSPSVSLSDVNVTFTYDFALNITVTKTVDKNEIKEGEVVEVTIRIKNNDNETAHDVYLQDNNLLHYYNKSVEIVEGSLVREIGDLEPGQEVVHQYKIKFNVEGYYTLPPTNVTYKLEGSVRMRESNPAYLRVLPLQVQEMTLKLIQEHPVPSIIFLATIVYIAVVKVADFMKKKKGVKPVKGAPERREEEEEEEIFFTE